MGGMIIGGLSDEQLKLFFINGLGHAIRVQGASQDPKTLQEALEKARLYESLLGVGGDVGDTFELLATKENQKIQEVETEGKDVFNLFVASTMRDIENLKAE